MQTQCNENKTKNTVDAADQLREGEGKLTPLAGIGCFLSDVPVQQIFFAKNRDHPDGPAYTVRQFQL